MGVLYSMHKTNGGVAIKHEPTGKVVAIKKTTREALAHADSLRFNVFKASIKGKREAKYTGPHTDVNPGADRHIRRVAGA